MSKLMHFVNAQTGEVRSMPEDTNPEAWPLASEGWGQAPQSINGIDVDPADLPALVHPTQPDLNLIRKYQS